METKMVKNKFTLGDFEKVEEFLANEHCNGWKFIRYEKRNYIFEKCEPEDIIYKLDFITEKKSAESDITERIVDFFHGDSGVFDEEGYIQFFAEYGWEYVGNQSHFYCFRKPKSMIKEENELFSDNQSKIEMCNKIIKRNGAITLAVAALSIFGYLYYDAPSYSSLIMTTISTFIQCIISITLVFYLFHLGHDYDKLNTLKKSYSNPLKEIEEQNKKNS